MNPLPNPNRPVPAPPALINIPPIHAVPIPAPVAPFRTVDPRIAVNQSLEGILETMRYYVYTNPYRINFTPAFLNAFHGMLQIDRELSGPQFEQIIAQYRSSRNELLALRINLFRLQLRVILRRRIIIEIDCPDNPNIQILIQIFNRKIQSILNILEAQHEMEGDENDPRTNAFINIVNTQTPFNINIYIQNLRTAQITLLAQRNQIVLANIVLTIQHTRLLPSVTAFASEVHTLNTSDWLTYTTPTFIEAKSKLDEFRVSKELCEKEIIDLEQSIQKQTQDADVFEHTVLAKHKSEVEKAVTDTIDQLVKKQAEKKTIYDALLKKIEEFCDQIVPAKVQQYYDTTLAQLNSPDAGLHEMKNVYGAMFTRHREEIDNFVIVYTEQHTTESLIDFLKNPDNLTNANAFQYKTEIATNEHRFKCLQDMLRILQLCAQNFDGVPNNQLFDFIKELLNVLIALYTEQIIHEQEQKQKVVAAVANQNSNHSMPTAFNYVSELNVLKLKLEQLQLQLHTLTLVQSTEDTTFHSNHGDIMKVFTELKTVTDQHDIELVDTINSLIALKEEFQKTYTKMVNAHLDVKKLEQEHDQLKSDYDEINLLVERQGLPQPPAPMNFGKSISLNEIYHLYKHCYQLYYQPLLMKSQALLIKGLYDDDVKNIAMSFIPLHYILIEDDTKKKIQKIYNNVNDNILVNRYDRDITLTNGLNSLIVQDIGLSIKDESVKIPDVHFKNEYVHVGMCVEAVLKNYLLNSSSIDSTVLDSIKRWLDHKTTMVHKADPALVNKAFEKYVNTDKTKCEVVIYEMCNTLYRDPMYRFALHPSGYSNSIENLQIDYYNTTSKIGYDTGSYARSDAVKVLDTKYRFITEHYLIDNKLSKIYLHSADFAIEKDNYFMSNMVKMLINPTEQNISMQWTLYSIQTKVKENNHAAVLTMVEKLIRCIQSHDDIENVRFKDYHGVSDLDCIADAESFNVIFTWKSKNTSELFVCTVHDDHITEVPDNESENDTSETERIKCHVLNNYSGIKQLLDPCAMKSSLVHFDLPKQTANRFGVRCDLSVRKYTYKRIWVILDTSDYTPEHKFECPFPYIDTSFLKSYHDLSIVSQLLKTSTPNNIYVMYQKRVDFLKNICYEQVFEKLKRLINENCFLDSTSILQSLSNDFSEQFPDNLQSIINEIETYNKKKTVLGKLFLVLGTVDNIIMFNNTETDNILTRFQKGLLSFFRIFLRT